MKSLIYNSEVVLSLNTLFWDGTTPYMLLMTPDFTVQFMFRLQTCTKTTACKVVRKEIKRPESIQRETADNIRHDKKETFTSKSEQSSQSC